MEILDEDVQMVRDFLSQWGAPEYIKGHFENLVSERAKEAGQAADLKERVESLQEEIVGFDDLKRDFAELQDELDAQDGAAFSALETVKYWLHDVLVLKRPMQTPPRQILRIVEDVL